MAYTIKKGETGVFYSVLDSDGEPIAADCEHSDAKLIVKALNGHQKIKEILKGVEDDVSVLAMAELTGQKKLTNIYKAFNQIQGIVGGK